MLAAEGALQRGETIKLVEDDVGDGVALELDHDAKTVAVGFVAQRRNALDLLLAPEFPDALDHDGLVHLVGNLADDDDLAVAAQRLDLDLAAHDDRAAAGVIGRADALMAEDDAAGREVGTGDDADQVLDAQRRIVDQRDAGVDHLAEIVGRDVGRHADGNAAGAVDQEVREPRRQDHRLFFVAVVVGLEVDGVLVDVRKQRHRRVVETALGVPHRRRRIAVDRAVIALPVDQRQAHREILRHAHQRVVDRLVAVRVILTHHVADHAGRFDVFLVRRMAVLVHRKQDAPMHRLETVTRVRERPRHDHAHGVIEVAALHLLRDGNGANVRGRLGAVG